MLPESVERSWNALAAEADTTPEVFDPATVNGLPTPAARWLNRAIPAGAPLHRVVELDMTGRIRLGNRWLPFTAKQILRAEVGFVWEAVVGGRLLRFVGADLLGPDGARMEFRLHRVVPVARASGPDTARSAAGRLAAETVAWLPAGVTPQLGATWTPLDEHRAVAAIATPGGPVDVTVTVGDDGRLSAITLQRWNDAARPPALQAFGADITAEAITSDGVRIAAGGSVGWGHGTAGWAEGRFFEFALGPTIAEEHSRR